LNAATADQLAPDAHILVIQVARIGDTLLITPALRALKRAYPRAHLTVLAHPARRALLENLDFIDTLGSIAPKFAFLRGRARAAGWNVALVYGQDAPLIRYAARMAPRVIAFEQKDAALKRLLWRAVKPPSAPLHAVHERLLLFAPIGVECEDFRLAYRVTETERAAAAAWLAARGAGATHPLVGLQVASFPTKAYRDWPLTAFTELGRRVLATYPGARLIVLGAEESRPAARALAQELGARVLSAAGELDLRATGALLSTLDLYVGVDTGPTHLAGALRVPMVALYHCRHRGRLLAPLDHPRLRVIEHPTTDDHCDPTAPMSAITVDVVWEQVRAALAAPAGK
jgi:heptosyltransferase-3